MGSLQASKDEWSERLIAILTPLIIEGFKAMFLESKKICEDNKESEKYLLTFQNLLSFVPKWNATMISDERKRIIEKSKCDYLEDLVTCVHIIQVKILTLMRVGQKQKKIDINIPKLDDFLHKCYIHAARKLFKNVYLYETNISPLRIQEHNRTIEIIIRGCILDAIRDSIPVENILRAYMAESIEEDYVEEIKEQIVEVEKKPETVFGGDVEVKPESKPESIKFNDVDNVLNENGKEELVEAPKTIERLEEISTLRNIQRKMEEEDDSDKLNITDELVTLDIADINANEPPQTDEFALADLVIEEI